MNNISNHDKTSKGGYSAADFTRILRHIELLRSMTVERSCTPSEAEVAARKIGELVQRYGLVVRPPRSDHQIADRTVLIHEVEAIAKTDKALLCVIDDQERWVPFSQIAEESQVVERGDFGILIVTRWYAEREGLCLGRPQC